MEQDTTPFDLPSPLTSDRAAMDRWRLAGPSHRDELVDSFGLSASAAYWSTWSVERAWDFEVAVLDRSVRGLGYAVAQVRDPGHADHAGQLELDVLRAEMVELAGRPTITRRSRSPALRRSLRAAADHYDGRLLTRQWWPLWEVGQ